MYTHKISYTKTFLTGALVGLSTEGSFHTTSDAILLHVAKMNKKNNKFTVSNITVEQI